MVFSPRWLLHIASFFCSTSLCLRKLLLLLLHLWWFVPVLLLSLLQLWWAPLGVYQQLWLSMMWSYCHCWCHGNTRGVAGFATKLQQLPQSQIPFQAYANYVMGPPQVRFSFRVEPPTDFSIYNGVCYGVCFLFSGSTLDASFTYDGSITGICITTALQSIPMAGICKSWLWSKAHTRNALLSPLLWVGGALCYSVSCPPAIPPIRWGIQLRQLGSHPIPLPSLHSGEGSSFPGLFHMMTQSILNLWWALKPGYSSVVIGFQVDEFTHPLVMEHFVAQSHIYPGFTGKVS